MGTVFKMAYRMELAGDFENKESLPLVNLGGLPALAKRKAGTFSMYEGKVPSAKKKRCLVTEVDTETGPLIYVGRNYGEGSLRTAPTGYRYLVGVRDKKKGVLKLHRACIYNIEPVFAEEESSKEPELQTETFVEKMTKVTEAFGSEKRKRLMAASLRNKIDVTTLDTTLAPAIAVAEEHVENMIVMEASSSSVLVPPCNKEAQTPEEVYNLEDIATSSDLELLDDLSKGILEDSSQVVDEWRREESIPHFVMDRISAMKGSSNSSSLQRMRQLLYLSCLVSLFRQNSKDLYRNGPEFPMGFPDGVTSGILMKFASPGKSKRSFQMTKLQKDRLLNYLLTLVLIIEKFSFSYMALARDLKVTGTKMTTHLRCLGCSVTGSGRSDKGSDLAILKIPLSFPKPKREKGKNTRN